MEIEKKVMGESSLYIKPHGRIDTNTAMDFGMQVTDELDDVKDLILDFEHVDYVSSIGLRILLELQKRMKTQGSMKLINVKENVMDVFVCTGFNNILTII